MCVEFSLIGTLFAIDMTGEKCPKQSGFTIYILICFTTLSLHWILLLLSVEIIDSLEMNEVGVSVNGALHLDAGPLFIV